MINGYKQIDVQDTTENATIYKASKDNKFYFMYEYEIFNQCDQFSFKIIAKLATCTHILKTIEKFQNNGMTYFITEYAQSNLLKQQFKQTNRVFTLKPALQYFCKVIQLLQQLHSRGLIYRDVCPEKIKVKQGELFLNDFNLSQFQKRKERLFQVVGLEMYLAPEFFTEDGYGQEVDIWAAGVLLYYMLSQEYPFIFQGKSQKQFLSEFNSKCKGGFKFSQIISSSKKSSHLKNNKILDSFFQQIFQMDYQKRITISQIKKHKLFQGLFQNQVDHQMLEAIGERDQSLFISQLGEFPSAYDFHKDQVILQFMEHASQSFMLDCADLIPEKLREQTRFSILKVALMRTNNLEQIIYGKKKPQFEIGQKQWEEMRNTTAFQLIKQKIQRKQKLILAYYKGALMNVQQQKNQFYSQSIPQDFQDIKLQYRTNLMKMFQFGKNLMKKKADRKSTRKICQNLVKLTILCLINRIFQESDLNQNFQLYFKWSNIKTLEQIQSWIANQKIHNLKTFMKKMTSKYLE